MQMQMQVLGLGPVILPSKNTNNTGNQRTTRIGMASCESTMLLILSVPPLSFSVHDGRKKRVG